VFRLLSMGATGGGQVSGARLEPPEQ
jgi:hypothetical protein